MEEPISNINNSLNQLLDVVSCLTEEQSLLISQKSDLKKGEEKLRFDLESKIVEIKEQGDEIQTLKNQLSSYHSSNLESIQSFNSSIEKEIQFQKLSQDFSLIKKENERMNEILSHDQHIISQLKQQKEELKREKRRVEKQAQIKLSELMINKKKKAASHEDITTLQNKVEELERELNFINTKNASTELTQDDEEIISPNMKRQRIS